MTDIINFINQNQKTVIILAGVLLAGFFIWNIYLSYSLLKIKQKSRSFFAGKDAKDLEQIIYKQIEKSGEIDKNIEKIFDENINIRKNVEKCVQKVGIVRFNPFGDMGGNQSFTIALLDNSLSGVMILSLYSRDGVKIYSKQIVNGKSEYKLSEEEQEAIKIASSN